MIGFHDLCWEWQIRHQSSAAAQKGVTLLNSPRGGIRMLPSLLTSGLLGKLGEKVVCCGGACLPFLILMRYKEKRREIKLVLESPS